MFTQEMIPALKADAEYLDMTPESDDILSTSVVEVGYCVESGVKVNE